MGLVNRVITVANGDAMQWSRRLAREEGNLVGTSSGATFAGAMKLASEAPKGTTILCMLPDTGERYLSTPLFAEVLPDMSDEEWAIAKSTPSAQLAPPAKQPGGGEPPPIACFQTIADIDRAKCDATRRDTRGSYFAIPS